MTREYDLTNELGKGNWIDAIAGEAVVLGRTSNNPELTALGTELAIMIKSIRYDDENFCLVEAKAEWLSQLVEETKKRDRTCLFIDDIFEGDEKHKPLDKWEYDLICVDNRYQIQMVLPRYVPGMSVVGEREKVSELIRSIYDGFEDFVQTEEFMDYTTQLFRISKFFDGEKLVSRIVDHDHEGGMFRGWLEIYYFDEFVVAYEAWERVKKYLSDAKKY